MPRPLRSLTARFAAFGFSLAALLIAPKTVVSEEAGNPPSGGWQTHINDDNPLVGTIYSVSEGKAITAAKLYEALSEHRFVLLGEIHDNPDHHKLQALIIEEMVRHGRHPAVVMEQINADQAGLLKLFMSGTNKTAARLGPAIEWQNQGWPAWSTYQPIAEAALKAGLDIVAGDTSKQMNRKIGVEGYKALPEAEPKQLGIDLPLGKKLEDALLDDLVDSHCRMMQAERMRPMALIQRYRDAHLARAMREAGATDGTVLITGNGHARTDRGVPWYLRGAQLESTTLMFIEAQKGTDNPLELIPRSPSGKPTADYIWVTPGAEREDPCEKLRQHMQK